jgi:hypothetical protein
MPLLLLTQGKTNWKYIWIILILAVIVGGGILGWIKTKEVPPIELPEIKKPEKIVKDETAKLVPSEVEGWKTYRNEEYRFEIKYPEDFTIENINQGVKIVFPESYKNQSYIFKNDVKDAWIGVGTAIMDREGFKGDLCQKLKKLNDTEIAINNLNFIKGNITSHAMGGWYTDYNIYRILHNGNCYEILLAVTAQGPGAGAHGGMGPLPEDYADSESKEKFLSILDQILSTFRFLE